MPATTHARANTLPHIRKAHEYAADVVAGRILACNYVKLACKRFINDLKRSKKRDFPYRFDENIAERWCQFIELLPHVKGKWARDRQLITLEPWMCFVICNLFGWVGKADGLRRFLECYEEVPRKNAKSTKAAAIGLGMLAIDNEPGAEVYSGATSKDQAHEVFRPAKQMAERTDDFREAFGVQVNASNICIAENGSRFEPVIGKPGDGASPSCALIDEYHEHPDDTLYDTMKTGMGAREQPLLFVITTAGEDIAGPCYAARSAAIDVLAGTVENDRLFAIIYTIDDGDDWTSEVALRKANPNYDVSVSGEWLRQQQLEAIRSPRKQNIFKTKHLNVWVTARDPWMNMELWNRCGDSTLSPEQFKGDPLFLGLDLSSKLDIATCARIFRREIDGKPHFYIFTRNYLPEAQTEKPEKRHYQAWIETGHLTATEGDIIDYDVIEADVRADAKDLGVAEVGYDPYGATQLCNNLAKDRIACVEVPQTVRMLSEPMKMIEGFVESGQIHHDNNPVLNWGMSNVTVREDANENIFPRKEGAEKKIDPATAVIIAMNRALAYNPKKRKPSWRPM